MKSVSKPKIINNHHILLTIDVEDWFQVENFREWIPFSTWSSFELRVEKNTHTLLNLLDSDNGRGTKLRATFFILGWIAERLPNLVREIHTRGHEVASHGYLHNLSTIQSYNDLKKDLRNSKKILEDIIGSPVNGYRASNFSINEDILKIIQECGYHYDSSYNSFAMHCRYGHLDLSPNGTRGIAVQISSNKQQATSNQQQSAIVNRQSSIFFELPISNLTLGKFVLPWGGGGYFRLTPFPLFRAGVQSILKREKAYLLYFHPWEIDPDQPRVNEASPSYKFRHYYNLRKAQSKLSLFLNSFSQYRFITCSQYLKEITE